MPNAWTHPKLGEFAADSSGWSTTAKVPAFKRFSYDTGYSNTRRSRGSVHVALRYFMLNDPVPNAAPPEMVTLLDKLLADPPALVDRVIAALWHDFNGRGPDSGMWWHGDTKTINKSFKSQGLPLPKKPEDLLPALQLTGVTVFKEWWDHPAPIGYLDFHAAFEREHGVSILTNADEILGTGYSDGSVMLWEHLRSKEPPRNPFG